MFLTREKQKENARKKLLFEREYSKLADTMPKITTHKKIAELNDQKSVISTQIAQLRDTMTALQDEQYKINVKINLLKNNEDPEEKKKKFIMACPSEGCRGFLSSAYKCELCNLYTCPRCREIVGYNKDNPDHVCNEDNGSISTTNHVERQAGMNRLLRECLANGRAQRM